MQLLFSRHFRCIIDISNANIRNCVNDYKYFPSICTAFDMRVEIHTN